MEEGGGGEVKAEEKGTVEERSVVERSRWRGRVVWGRNEEPHDEHRLSFLQHRRQVRNW